MKKDEKETLVADLRSRLERAQGAFLVDFKGLKVEQMNRLRGELRQCEVELQVVKNRLLKRASKDTAYALLAGHMVGPTAIATTETDVVAPAKVLMSLVKDLKELKIKGGQISGKVIDPDAIKRLAELPSREVLLAQVLSAMQAVPASFLRILNGVIAQLLYVLNAIGEKKEATQ